MTKAAKQACELYLGEQEVDWVSKPVTLADLVHWALDQGVPFDKVVFFTREDSYEPPGAFGKIAYASQPYACIEKG